MQARREAAALRNWNRTLSGPEECSFQPHVFSPVDGKVLIGDPHTFETCGREKFGHEVEVHRNLKICARKLGEGSIVAYCLLDCNQDIGPGGLRSAFG